MMLSIMFWSGVFVGLLFAVVTLIVLACILNGEGK